MDEESDQSIPAIPKNSPPTIASVPLAVTTKNSTAPQHRSFHRSYTCASPTTGPNLQQSSKLPCAPKPLNVDYIKEIMDHLKKMDLNHCPKIEALCYSCIVLPSIDLDPKEMQRFATPADLEGYEERQLYTLLLLQDPNVRLIFLSSLCVDPEVVSYYLSLLNINPRECLPRLFMLSPNESVSKPLSKKILARPQLLRTIRDIALENATHVGLCGYTGSPASIELAETLGIRLLATRNVKSLHFGTKQGSKEIFNACNVPSAPGTPSNHDDDLLTQGDISKSQTRYWTEHCRYIRTPKDLSMGIARQIKNFNIKPKRWMIKLNQGFSGRGNAILDLQQVQEHCYEDIEDMANDIETRFPTLRFECSAVTWDGNSFTGFRNQMKRIGCIGEAFLEGDSVRSPSVQGVISHDDSGGPRVRILSTHEQVLNGQTYFGCIFPAYNDYRKNLIEYGLRIGTELAKNGGEGNFSVDFIASRLSCKTWNLEAVEINLRTGACTLTSCISHNYPIATLVAIV